MKTAIVTGARRGIGLAIARALSDEYHVIMCATKDFTPPSDFSCEAVKCDISSEKDIELLFCRIKERGGLDLLVNNAGIAPKNRADILSVSRESFQELLDINLAGTFFMSQEAAKIMERQNSGIIINISSISAYASSVNRAEYCVSKAGVSMITKLFADRMAKSGVSVFEVRPGIIKTDMTAGVLDKYERMIENGLTPINRIGTPEDVANCVKALCSGQFSFCTGQVINADGGFSIRRL